MRELLVIADKEGGKQSAFFHALEIARSTGAMIEFVGFVHAAGVDSSEILSHEEKRKLRHKYIERKSAELAKFLDSVDTKGVKVRTDVVWEKSFESWVIARCNQKSFEIVFKSGNRSETFMYTPSDWQLMRHCSEPVMIVGESPWKAGGVILAALDLGSSNKHALELNETILKKTFQLAKATGCEVHACYSIAVPKALSDLDVINPKEYEEKMKESLDPIIRKLVEDAGLNREKLHLLLGKPAKEIVRISQVIKADMVVLGNKTNSSLRGRLLGNTAENVLHKVAADVLVVK